MIHLLQKKPIEFSGQIFKIPDINASFIIKTSVKDAATMLKTIKISHSDTPQSIANALYGNTSFDWIVLYAAGIVNEYKDWPKDNDSIWLYCQRNYTTGPNGIHHYESIVDGVIIDHYTQSKYLSGELPVPATVNVITNYIYELNENDKKKTIKVFSKESVMGILRKIEEVLAL